jgi:hypothetical protein
MKFVNDGDYPQPIYDALVHSDYDRGNSDYSITQLIDSPRIRRLKELFRDEISHSASEMAASVMGSAGHSLIEKHSKLPFVAEERIFHDINIIENTITISGAIDLQKINESGAREIIDLKTCKSYAVINGLKREWELQLNGYAWLMRNNGHDVTRLRVAAWIKDWNKRKALSESDYPSLELTMIDVPLWDFETQEEYFIERLFLHLEAQINDHTNLPLCSSEERWARPTTYALMKNKNKRALRVFEDRDEAEKKLKKQQASDDKNNYSIEVRLGENVRCKNFCKVAEFCNQNKDEQ